jgi:predicted negative regulator of RcsB-dependent stress response
MSTDRKEHIKSLKGPDQFQVQVMSLMDHAVKHWKVIVAVLVPVVLVAVGAYGYDVFQTNKKHARLEELGKVQVMFDAEQRTADDARGVLQTQLEAVEAKLEKNKDDATAKAEKAKLEQEMDAIVPKHDGSLAQYQEFFKKYGQTAEGWMAGMTAAKVLLDQEKVAEARTILEDVLKQSSESSFYQVQARLTLVSVLEEQGDFDQALAQIDALDKQADPELKPRVLLARGRIQMLKNARDEAKQTFSTLIENHGASPEAQKARSMQALLN